MPVLDLVPSLALERQADGDLRLARLPLDHRAAHRISSMAARHRSRVGHDAGRDADAAGAAGLARCDRG